MNDISCGICSDLMPLVQDGIANEDSIRAVKQHIEHCPECKALFEGEMPPLSDHKSREILKRIRKGTRGFLIALLLMGIFLGIGLTNGTELFLNSLLMPAVGILGYAVFKWRSLYLLPAVLFITLLGTQVVGFMMDPQNVDIMPVWALIYSIFAEAGILIAGLLHFAFKKEDWEGTGNEEENENEHKKENL